MNWLTLIKQKLLERKFKRLKLAQIHSIGLTQYNALIQGCLDNGWEKGRLYRDTDSWREDGQLTLQKGFTSIECRRENEDNGKITGPLLAVKELAKQHQLQVSDKPKITRTRDKPRLSITLF